MQGPHIQRDWEMSYIRVELGMDLSSSSKLPIVLL